MLNDEQTTESHADNEGAYPKERIPCEVKHINDPSMGIPDGVVCGTEDSDKWDKNERS